MENSLIPGSHSRPPSRADMIHELVGNQKTPNTQSLAQPALSRLEMSWEADVEDTYPIIGTSVFFFMKTFPNPHKMVYLTSLEDPDRVVTALRTSLESWPVLRSIAVEYNQATCLLVVLRATKRYFDRAISVHAEVENEQALTDISMSGNHAESELPRDLMLRIVVAKVKSTKTTGLVILVNHAIYDGVSNTAWLTDVAALVGGNSVTRGIPYKAFAEAYYLHQTSLAGKMATEYHVKRLRGIGRLRHAIWPPLHLFPSRNIGASMTNVEGKAEAVEGGGYNNAEVIRYRHCLNIAVFSGKLSTLFNAAIAIFNASITGSKHAIFAVVQSGREWPFINDSLAQLMPNPMRVAGPTMTGTVVVVDLSQDDELISHYLDRLEVEQRLWNRYQHVPLDFVAHFGEEDLAVLQHAQRQSVNYQPKDEGASSDSLWSFVLDRDYKVDKPSDSFVWECGLKGRELRIRAMFNPDIFSEIQAARFIESLFNIVEFLSDTGNRVKVVRDARAVRSIGESRL